MIKGLTDQSISLSKTPIFPQSISETLRSQVVDIPDLSPSIFSKEDLGAPLPIAASPQAADKGKEKQKKLPEKNVKYVFRDQVQGN